jgi:hypothetical protein
MPVKQAGNAAAHAANRVLVNAPHLLVKHAACHQLAVVDGAANLAHHADVAQVQPAQKNKRGALLVGFDAFV